MKQPTRISIAVQVPLKDIPLSEEEKAAILQELKSVRIREILESNPTLRDLDWTAEWDIKWA